MKTLIGSLLFSFMLLYSASCFRQTQVDDVVSDAPHFPRMAESARGEQMEALLTGKLIFRNRCFRIIPAEGDVMYTPIWPAGFDYQLEPDSVFIILNAAGNEVARTGLGIRISGGAIGDPQVLVGQIENGLPKLLLSCPVPYWMVGNEITVYEPDLGLSTEVQYQLSDWFDFYRPHIENWRLSAFEIEEEWRIDSLLTVSGENILPLEDRSANWLIPSPDDRYNLDLYARDLVVDQTNGTVKMYAMSPDSEAALEDRLAKKRYRLLFCGTPCRFEAGYWPDEETVIIAGLHQEENDQFHPTIWKISLNELSVKQYTYPTPLVPPFPHNYVQDRVFRSS
jgi:hypothetical protein